MKKGKLRIQIWTSLIVRCSQRHLKINNSKGVRKKIMLQNTLKKEGQESILFSVPIICKITYFDYIDLN